jgi:predicted aldo/keto reductase-like oxidoreductase
VISAWMIGCEHQSHLDRLLDYSYAVGIDHIETARHYLESEAQLKPVLQRQRKKNQNWDVQTKGKSELL